MQTLPVSEIDDGDPIPYVSATDTALEFAIRGREVIFARKSTGGTTTVSINSTRTCAHDANHDVQVTIGGTSEPDVIQALDPLYYERGSSRMADITLGAFADVDIAVVRLGGHRKRPVVSGTQPPTTNLLVLDVHDATDQTFEDIGYVQADLHNIFVLSGGEWVRVVNVGVNPITATAHAQNPCDQGFIDSLVQTITQAQRSFDFGPLDQYRYGYTLSGQPMRGYIEIDRNGNAVEEVGIAAIRRI